MYTQEIVCPHCGKPAIVNVLDKKGTTKTPCQNCKKKIIVYTDRHAKIESIVKDESCLIATTCLNSQENILPEEKKHALQLIRTFRDSYLICTDDGRSILADYYQIAPQIVSAILSQKNHITILSDIYEQYIQKAVELINKNMESEAIQLHLRFMDELKVKYLHNKSTAHTNKGEFA